MSKAFQEACQLKMILAQLRRCLNDILLRSISCRKGGNSPLERLKKVGVDTKIYLL